VDHPRPARLHACPGRRLAIAARRAATTGAPSPASGAPGSRSRILHRIPQCRALPGRSDHPRPPPTRVSARLPGRGSSFPLQEVPMIDRQSAGIRWLAPATDRGRRQQVVEPLRADRRRPAGGV